MQLNKLITRKQKQNKENVYTITLPKYVIEKIAKWFPGQELEVVWIDKEKAIIPFNKPYFRISKPDNLWVDKKGE